jgi:hypothetical protein
MKRTIPLLLAVVLVASCDDDRTKATAVPTAPTVAPLATKASASAAGVSGGSTICRVYVTERDVAKTQLDAAPTDTLQQRRVAMLDALVEETCN